jgi:hypothetical protein
MSKFKVGDIVTGLSGNDYAVTTKDAILEVTTVHSRSIMEVKVLESKDEYGSKRVGRTYDVESDRFKLVKQAKKPLASVIPDYTMTELIHMISDKLGIKPQAFKLQPLGLFRLGTQFGSVHQGEFVQHDLSEYFIDEEGTMYSRNNDTYFTKYGKRLTKLSDNSINASGKIVNSFRDKRGLKVTISRERIKRMMRDWQLEDVTLMSLEDEKVEGIGQLVG